MASMVLNHILEVLKLGKTLKIRIGSNLARLHLGVV